MRQLISAAALLALLPSAQAVAADVPASESIQVTLEIAESDPNDRVVTITGLEPFLDGGVRQKSPTFQTTPQQLFESYNSFCVSVSENSVITYNTIITLGQTNYATPGYEFLTANFALVGASFVIPVAINFQKSGYYQVLSPGDTINQSSFGSCDPNAEFSTDPDFFGFQIAAFYAQGALPAPDIPAGIYVGNFLLTVAPQ